MAEANRGVQHGWQPESKNQYNLEVDRGVEESGCKRRSPSLRGRQNRLFPVAETLRQPGCRHPMQRGAFQEKKEKEKEVSHPSRRSVANRNAKQRAAHNNNARQSRAQEKGTGIERESEGSRSFKTSVIEQAAGRPHCQQDREESRP